MSIANSASQESTEMKLQDAASAVQKISPLPIPPFLLNDEFYESLAEPASLNAVIQPLPSWTFARKRTNGEKLPQAIAHRGYKAKHPENTMGAFRGAVEANSNAIETDIHVTKDDVVVLSHDPTLKRCFGKDNKIIDCTWDYISQQRTIIEPHEPMPRLFDLLKYLSTPGLEHIWVLLDIKINNDPEKVMKLIASTISEVAPNSRTWNQRLVLGCWALKYLPLCARYLPAFPISHIGFSIPYARQFLTVPNVSFNMLQYSLIMPYFGARFLRDAKSKGIPIFDWTVNQDNIMKWSISKKLDGVLTDDPKRFLEMCDEWERGQRDIRFTAKDWVTIIWINFLIVVFGSIFWWRYGSMQKRMDEKARKGVPASSKWKTNATS